MISFLINFVHEWLTLGLSVALIVAAGFAYFRLPLFGKEAAIGLVAAAVGLAAYSKGYGDRGDLDKSAALRAQIELLNKDLEISKAAATDAFNRATELDKQQSDANQKVQDYERELASRKDDTCGINDDDLRRLRGIYGPN